MGLWDLGEGSGYSGNNLAIYLISCPFCSETGLFDVKSHAEKKKPNSNKKLNFDTLVCGHCKGYVMVLWSASESGGKHGIHDFRVLPRPGRLVRYPDAYPENLGRCWIQAKRSIDDENWDAAALMARTSLQIALRDQGAESTAGNLKGEIKDLVEKGILPALMEDWSTEIRILGNEAAHQLPGSEPTIPKDARDVVNFLDYLLEYLYLLPSQIAKYRSRRDIDEETG